MDSAETFKHGAFHIQVYGRGSPRRMLIGGLAYAPSDYSLLAQNLPGTSAVIDNPMHTGRVPWNAEWLREQYAELLNALDCDTLVAHSLGNLDALEVQRKTQGRIRRLICITPPLTGHLARKNIPRLPPEESSAFGVLDSALSDVGIDMDIEHYRTFLADHHRQYGARLKENYKRGMPKRSEIPKIVEGMVNDIRAMQGCSVLAILGSQDIWMPRSPQDIPKLGDHVTLRIMNAGHYPHRTLSGEVSRAIIDWETMPRPTTVSRDIRLAASGGVNVEK